MDEPETPPPSEDDEVERPRSGMVRMPMAWLERALAAGYFAASGAWAVARYFDLDVPSSAVPAVVVALLLSVAAGLRAAKPTSAELSVEDGALWVRRGRDLRKIPLEAIAHAERAHRPDGGIGLQLRDVRGALLAQITVGSAEEAEAWIERLGLSLTAREVSAVPSMLSVGVVEQRLYAALALLVSLLTPGSAPAAATMVWQLFRQTTIRIGVDGIEERRLGRRRFHPFSEIESVIHTDVIQLVMKSGKTVTLDLPRHGTSRAQVDDVAATIARARAVHAASASSDVAADRLARKGAPVEDWLARLAELERRDAYRDAAPTSERLAQVLEDPQADPTSRAGAAWLLARAGQKDPVRRAHVHTADVKVRVALDAALEADDEALDEATAELEAARRAR